MNDEMEKEYEIFLNSKEVHPSKEISEKVLLNAKLHLAKPSTKMKIKFFQFKCHIKSILIKSDNL